MKITFAHPELAPLFLAALVVLALAALTLVRRRRAAAAFGGAGAPLISASPARQVAKLALLAVALLATVAALVGPQIGEAPRRGATATVDTVIALDVSQSMAVTDVAPDRLRVAQQAIQQIAQQLVGGRVGLILFAGSGTSRYPLTADTKVLGPALDYSGRGFRINPGSSLRVALQGAAALFPTDAAGLSREKAIILISDGEDLAPDAPLLEPLRQRNITVFTIGVGTTSGGPVPIYDDKGKLVQMLVNTNGSQIISRLDEARLQSIAEQGGGRYWRFDADATAREVGDAIRAIAVAGDTVEAGVSPEDRYQLFLAVAVLALFAEWLLDERRRMPRPQMPRIRVGRRRLVAFIGSCLALVTACGPSDPIADQVDAANATFQRDPAAAVVRYRDLITQRPNSAELAIDLANTYLKLSDPDRALVEYGRAIDNARSSTKAIAFYDRGNALFRLGRVVEARASYVEALRLDPTDRDAKFNIEVIDRILGLVRNGQPGQASSPPGQPSNVPNLNGQPGGSPGPTGPDGPGAAGGTPPPGANDRPTSSQQPSVQSALTDFRRDLTVDEALKLLDALKGEQRGIEGLVQGTGVRRGGNVDVPY
ncbi:MAG: VWA domain-containing protein [Chloroflexi bacterium]|nr:MAG: VWA domain-containing protein [Chloroflexota bacterium]